MIPSPSVKQRNSPPVLSTSGCKVRLPQAVPHASLSPQSVLFPSPESGQPGVQKRVGVLRSPLFFPLPSVKISHTQRFLPPGRSPQSVRPAQSGHAPGTVPSQSPPAARALRTSRFPQTPATASVRCTAQLLPALSPFAPAAVLPAHSFSGR